MKKKLSIITIATLLLTSQSYAKTEGNYAGLNILRNTAKVKSTSTLAKDNLGGLAKYYNHNNKDSAYGFGVNYKYAFNFNNFFVAPEISYEFLDNNVKSGYRESNSDFFSQNVKLKNSVSIKANLGYDVNDQFAFYVPVGISSFSYEVNTNDTFGYYNTTTSIKNKTTGNKSAAFIGLGFSYEPIKTNKKY